MKAVELGGLRGPPQKIGRSLGKCRRSLRWDYFRVARDAAKTGPQLLVARRPVNNSHEAGVTKGSSGCQVSPGWR